MNVNLNSDSRRVLSLQASANGSWNESGGWNRNLGVTAVMRPSPVLSFSLGPQLTRSFTTAQYVGTVDDPLAIATFGRRHLFGRLDQTQLSLTMRANAVVSSRLSLQVYTQPLLAAGDYSGFRELARPRTYDFIEYDGVSPPFSLANPDFNLKSLRVNTVLRWELKPGSTFYAVWTRQQQDASHPGDVALGRDLAALTSAAGDDVVMVKVAYWLGR